jgi:hypothetical protein
MSRVKIIAAITGLAAAGLGLAACNSTTVKLPKPNKSEESDKEPTYITMSESVKGHLLHCVISPYAKSQGVTSCSKLSDLHETYPAIYCQYVNFNYEDSEHEVNKMKTKIVEHWEKRDWIFSPVPPNGDWKKFCRDKKGYKVDGSYALGVHWGPSNFNSYCYTILGKKIMRECPE